MTQVLSVSATSAGYVADTLKPPQRVVQADYVGQINKQIYAKKQKVEAASKSTVAGLMESSAMGLYFMKAGQNKNPRASLEETQQAYEEAEKLGEER
ncbi:hypothetical protein [Rhizobium paknamense]|uniref:Uncharacterized protein n=1 Tax=Rhizobium paknamense TaxID=1206817 RepID=A0ABU0ICB4_9HYPH|nr:hypothetical protein [Rhizobium paknamense]MDQ0455882.1 hypothetical protein [Rhizobium paknamense]